MSGQVVSNPPDRRFHRTGISSYPKDRFEAACRIALGQASSPRYRLIQAILINNQDLIRRDQEAIPKENSQATEESGAFIRGAAYYGGGDPDAE